MTRSPAPAAERPSPADLSAYVRSLRSHYGFPALSVGYLKAGRISVAADGRLNLRTGVKARADSLFQIASITKIYTSILVMQLAEAGKLDIDDCMEDLLPGLRFADPAARRHITPRHLMAHTSGVDGDFDMSASLSLQAYASRCAAVPLLFPPGESWSYSNAGYVLLGRLIEHVTDQTWQQAMQDNIFHPLGLSASLVDPFDLVNHRAAAGHLQQGPDSTLRPAEQVCFGQSMQPAGSFTMQAAGDLLTLADDILSAWRDGGVPKLLSAGSFKEMARSHIALPPHNALDASGWGLGFTRLVEGGLGHAGGTPGCTSFVSIQPEHDAAYAILINCHVPTMRNALRDIRQDLHHHLTETNRPAVAETEGTIDQAFAERLCGRYACVSGQAEVFLSDGRVCVTQTAHDTPDWRMDCYLEPLDRGAYASFDHKTAQRGANINIIQDITPHGGPCLLLAGRLHRRICA